MAAGRVPDPVGTARERDARRRLSRGGADLHADDERRGPDLPGEDRFRQETRDWYATWRRSPQAEQFLVTDWQRLHMLAAIVDKFFEAPSAQLMAEIRLNEERFGATPTDRLRLGYRVRPAQRGPAQTAPITGSSRSRLRGDNGGGERWGALEYARQRAEQQHADGEAG
jgi:hypothetical protein